MITVSPLRIGEKSCVGLKVDPPDTPSIILIIADKGFVMCGLLNVDIAEKLGVSAAMVSGVKSFEDVLHGEVKAATSKAKSLGVYIGQTGADALRKLT